MEYLHFIALFLAAALAGAINSVAGGGTFLTFPILMWTGQSAIAANITSTIALWPGSIAGAFAYRGEWRQETARLPMLLIVSVTGGVIGAWLLLVTPEAEFRALVPWLLLSATLIFTFGRKAVAWLNNVTRAHERERPSPLRLLSTRAMQLAIAIYGGYFGAGIGILMLAMLQLSGMTQIHCMNAVKTVLGSAINAVAVIMFIASGAVMWPAALVMVAGAVLGGYAGGRAALKLPPEAVRWIVSAIGAGMTIYFFAYA